MVTYAHAAQRPDSTTRFHHYWLAETLRLRESQWGPLQDSQETRRARTLGDDFAQRLLLRATYLGQREGIDTLIQRWTTGARLAFLILAGLAVLTGAAAAAGALGDGTRQVNLALALTALLGLHALTFLFWCVSSLIPSSTTQSGLGDLWLWLTRKLARGPDAALVPRALAGMLARQNALRPLLGAVSHALWSLALTAMIVTLVALLSARRYTFNWETTLLSPDTFVRFTNALGWLPSKLGFNIPPDAIIRASDGLQTLPDSAHTLWSGWLIGCLVCYGLLPRVLALLATAMKTTRQIRKLTLDTGLPGYIELRDRLDPLSAPGGIDAPATEVSDPQPHPDAHTPLSTQDAIVGLELAPDTRWPPAPLASSVTNLGMIDDRHQRQRLLESLSAHGPHRLLIVCDGDQTPDRGVIALIRELGSLAGQAHLVLLNNNGHPPASPSADNHHDNDNNNNQAASPSFKPSDTVLTRQDLWKQQLQHAGFSAEDIHTDLTHAISWLTADAIDATSPDCAP